MVMRAQQAPAPGHLHELGSLRVVLNFSGVPVVRKARDQGPTSF
jgi:hypothetical protein